MKPQVLFIIKAGNPLIQDPKITEEYQKPRETAHKNIKKKRFA